MTDQTHTLNDQDLADRFENFDFANATQMGRDPLRALHWATQVRDYVNTHMAEVVEEARESGATWTQIGQALGVSHQAAMKRYKQST